MREVFDDAQRAELVETVAGGLSGVIEPVLSNAFQYWKNVDQAVGEAIEKKVLEGRGDDFPGV